MDDDEGFLECAKELLELQGGFKVTTIDGVDKALKTLSRDNFDVVVSDYEIPEKTN